MYKVIIKALSIEPQLEAIGVCHHGLKIWNRIEPSTNSAMTIATRILAPVRGDRHQTCGRDLVVNPHAELT